MEHDAVTASATLASGAPGAPKTTRLPLALSTQQIRSRPSKRAPERATSAWSPSSRLPELGARASSAERASAPPGAPRAMAAGARGAVAAQPQRAALRASRQLAPCAPGSSASGGAAGAPTSSAPPSRGRHGDRPAASVAVHPAQVDSGGVLDPGEHAGHPGLPDHAPAGEDENVGHHEPGHRPRLPACHSNYICM